MMIQFCLPTQQEDIGADGKEKVVLTAEEMDTILQQTTEANLSLEEGQGKQEGKGADAKQQRSAQEDKNLHVLYGKDSTSEEVSLFVVSWRYKATDIFLSIMFGGGFSVVQFCSHITVNVSVTAA